MTRFRRWVKRMRTDVRCRLLGRHRDVLYHVGHNFGKECRFCGRPGLLTMADIKEVQGAVSWLYRRGGEHEMVAEAEASRSTDGP